VNIPPRLELNGRIALVTGASSGLGARFAEVLARAGAKVVIGARRVEKLRTVEGVIVAAGGEVLAVELDVSDEASVMAAYDQAEARWGVVDTIVANAGQSWTGRTTEMSAEAFDENLAVNLRGAYLTAREGAKRLIGADSRASGRGRIVFISSITAHRPEAGITAYSAAKAGVVAMAKAMAVEWARQGINVNAICPGYIKTELNDAWFESVGGADQVARFHRRRLMDIGDLDALLLLLCSDASRAITGSAITVDDGQSL
jgi:NAD(P)-dependent dehydrogenase (short-subunit alcohol dehydrogenase family)